MLKVALNLIALLFGTSTIPNRLHGYDESSRPLSSVCYIILHQLYSSKNNLNHISEPR